MEQKHKIVTKNRIIIIAVLIICLTVGVSYAYFAQQAGKGAITNISVDIENVDRLNFEVDKDLSIVLTQFNLMENGENLKDTSIGTATLITSGTRDFITNTYSVYFNINTNEYIYTTEDKKPELILTVKDPKGKAVTKIDGLNYVTVGDVSGFDITEQSGPFEINNRYEIVGSAKEQEVNQNWTITVSFINLDTNQNANANKIFSGKLILQRDAMATSLAEACAGKQMASCFRTYYNLDKTLIYHSSAINNSALDNSYRYAGSSSEVDNYICFGSNEVPCPEENLYRIIGLFNNSSQSGEKNYQVKIIKNTTIGNYYWSGAANNQSNIWTNSTLNTEILNGNSEGSFLYDLGAEWNNKIAMTTWNSGGVTFDKGTTNANGVYYYEVGAGKRAISNNAKIGLMYVSDYGFAAASKHWGTDLSEYNTINGENWLIMGTSILTITPNLNGSSYVFTVGNTGKMTYSYVNLNGNGIHPTFYLNSDVVLESGTGEISNPYRIN